MPRPISIEAEEAKVRNREKSKLYMRKLRLCPIYREKLRQKALAKWRDDPEYRSKRTALAAKYRKPAFRKSNGLAPHNPEEATQKSKKAWIERRSYWDEYRTKNKDRIAAKRLADAPQRAAYRKDYNQKNRDKINEYRRNVARTNMNFRVKKRVTWRIHKLLKSVNAKKSGRTIELLGCSIPQLMDHLQSLFSPGMQWNNHGQWHIDHIQPCSSFDLTDPAQQRACFHYTNLQPLWAEDNMKKGNKIPKHLKENHYV